MYIGYLDDSGQPIFADKENFCLAMVLINENEWKTVYGMIHDLRVDFQEFLDFENEIHLKNILNSKKYDINYKVIKLSEMYEKLLDVDFKIISAIMVKSEIPNINLKLNEIAFTRVFEKTSLFLKNNELNHKCIIFCDNEKNEEESNSYFRRLRMNGSKYVKEDYFVEEIVFDKGDFRICLQIADMIAVLVRRYVKARDKEKLNELDRMFLDLLPKFYDKFDKSEESMISGYGITFYPKVAEKIIRG